MAQRPPPTRPLLAAASSSVTASSDRPADPVVPPPPGAITLGSRRLQPSSFKGVKPVPGAPRQWRAQINWRSQLVDLGTYAVEVDAARAYDRFCLKSGDASLELNFLDTQLSDDEHAEKCTLCEEGGNLLLCDGCPRSFHPDCLDLPEDGLPEGEWLCAVCMLAAGKGPAACPLCGTDGITAVAEMEAHFVGRCDDARAAAAAAASAAPAPARSHRKPLFNAPSAADSTAAAVAAPVTATRMVVEAPIGAVTPATAASASSVAGTEASADDDASPTTVMAPTSAAGAHAPRFGSKGGRLGRPPTGGRSSGNKRKLSIDAATVAALVAAAGASAPDHAASSYGTSTLINVEGGREGRGLA